MTSENIEKQNDYSNLKCPGYEEFELWVNKEDFDDAVHSALSKQLQKDAYAHAGYTGSFEDIYLILDPHIVPAQIV